jgi:hypothetical protein
VFRLLEGIYQHFDKYVCVSVAFLENLTPGAPAFSCLDKRLAKQHGVFKVRHISIRWFGPFSFGHSP